jgi:hypothetical protein
MRLVSGLCEDSQINGLLLFFPAVHQRQPLVMGLGLLHHT